MGNGDGRECGEGALSMGIGDGRECVARVASARSALGCPELFWDNERSWFCIGGGEIGIFKLAVEYRNSIWVVYPVDDRCWRVFFHRFGLCFF